MSKQPVTTDPNTLANVVTGLGGRVIPGQTFRFDLPLAEVKQVIPKINALGVRCRDVGQRIEDDPVRPGCNHTVVTIELFKQTDEAFRLPEW
jgi:hypothetical protein